MTPARIARRNVLRTLDADAKASARAGDYPPNISRGFAPVPDLLIQPTRIELQAGRVRFWPLPECRSRTVNARLLPDFLSLSDADESDVLAFARTWDVFHFCRHGLPIDHSEECLFGPDAFAGSDRAFSEPVAAWFTWARRMREVFDAITCLRAGRPAKPTDLSFWLAQRDTPHPQTGSCGWLFVAHAINEWIHLAKLSPMLVVVGHVDSPGEEQPLIRLGNPRIGEGTSLLGALALQMLLFAVNGSEIAHCYGCGQYFPVDGRRRDPNRKTWCADCGKRAANVIARRKYRERQRTKAAGSSPRSAAKTPTTRNQAKGKRRGRPTRKA
jgi:hypothetical protein